MSNVKAAIEREQNEVYSDYAEREQARDEVSMFNFPLGTCDACVACRSKNVQCELLLHHFPTINDVDACGQTLQ